MLRNNKKNISHYKINSPQPISLINEKNTVELEGVVLPSKLKKNSGQFLNYKLKSATHETPLFIETDKIILVHNYLYDDVKVIGHFDNKQKYFVVKKIFKAIADYTCDYEEVLSDQQTDYLNLMNRINVYGKIEANVDLEAC